MDDDRSDLDFYKMLWRRLVGSEFTPQGLVDRVRRDGGYDMENLTDSDLLDLVEGRFSGPWSEAAFSFSELLAFYSVPGAIETTEQVAAWVFASLVVADAIGQEATDWEMQFNNFINGFLAARTKLEIEESIHIFQRIFVCSPPSG